MTRPKIQGDASVLFLDLPSFLWLWRAAAWSMGFTIAAYLLLALSGLWLGWQSRSASQNQGVSVPVSEWQGLRLVHLALGAIIVFLVLFLLAIGLVGTLGHFGSLIQSPHFAAGWIVVILTICAGITGLRISPDRPHSRTIHRVIDVALLVVLAIVTYTGWDVVQKYLP